MVSSGEPGVWKPRAGWLQSVCPCPAPSPPGLNTRPSGWKGLVPGGGPCVALQTCRAPPAPGECPTVQLSPRVAFLWVTGKARAVGGASRSPGPAIVCWACWPPGVAPPPPNTARPSPQRKCWCLQEMQDKAGRWVEGAWKMCLGPAGGAEGGGPTPHPKDEAFCCC